MWNYLIFFRLVLFLPSLVWAESSNFSPCENVSESQPIFIMTQKENYRFGDTVKALGCVSEKAFFKGINVQVFDSKGTILVGGAVVPQPDGSFSREFTIDKRYESDSVITVMADANGQYFAETKFTILNDKFSDNCPAKIQLDVYGAGWPVDISDDDKWILLFFGSGLNSLYNTETKEIQELKIPVEQAEDYEYRSNTRFSSLQENLIYFQYDNSIYTYDIENNQTTKITENVTFLDLIYDDNLVVLKRGVAENASSSIWLLNSDGSNPKNDF